MQLARIARRDESPCSCCSLLSPPASLLVRLCRQCAHGCAVPHRLVMLSLGIALFCARRAALEQQQSGSAPLIFLLHASRFLLPILPVPAPAGERSTINRLASVAHEQRSSNRKQGRSNEGLPRSDYRMHIVSQEWNERPMVVVQTQQVEQRIRSMNQNHHPHDRHAPYPTTRVRADDLRWGGGGAAAMAAGDGGGGGGEATDAPPATNATVVAFTASGGGGGGLAITRALAPEATPVCWTGSW